MRRHVLPAFGNVPLGRITQLDVRAWVADLAASGLAPATVHKAYQTFSKVMRSAVDGGFIAQSPCRSVSLPKIESQEMRFLTPTEIVALADAIAPHYRALVIFARTAACAWASWPASGGDASTCCAARSASSSQRSRCAAS